MIVEKPVTIEEIANDLRRLGVKAGMTLLVHSSLKSMGGWIVGGAEAVIMALEEVLGDEGTLVMPTHSADLTDPSTWRNPPADPKWWQLIRDSMPPYDKDFTLTSGMGQIPETFRRQSDVLRSAHPHVSFAARGRNAEVITQSHPLSDSLGEQSPLAKLYELGAYVLMLGTSYENNTSFHLAEYRGAWQGKQKITANAPVRREGGRTVWEEFSDINFDSDDFEQAGADYERDCPDGYTRGSVHNSTCILAQQRIMVDYAVKWIEANRKA
ncbi:aminoglycoside 3-N-acetyltransferase [Paenibacillus uliginis N3/975]|uniref:Aminoglycoside N(3)-acetyltransferase n=1 Tax=Paenibacillus uliginis N3/975 TaxID=1313296 RepID=A0A1X7GP12_9BACL|nr:AAC(3) family N-acetyltransferase [Paenibacillus uliginis]SMF71918.1 aminoglycoside 3-N-acetyltransferase [Paenibacillus uliginis N3/975]